MLYLSLSLNLKGNFSNYMVRNIVNQFKLLEIFHCSITVKIDWLFEQTMWLLATVLQLVNCCKYLFLHFINT